MNVPASRGRCLLRDSNTVPFASNTIAFSTCLCNGMKFKFTWCCFTCIFPSLFRTATLGCRYIQLTSHK
ncbi:unnamed protein product [Schistosoma mattheei]|uniref:Uncharacterized protein n=1 Tax=Schistosoma mattheei TaxID=31246 RepID=A0A3P8KH86_9TREM|nr:unnamed protein product [Schistosoma mattheei]